MNQCHFLGRLCADPELRPLGDNKRVVKFRIAVNRRFKRAGKDQAKETAFLDMEAWDTGADVISKYAKKGNQIIVHCSVVQDDWDDKTTGQKRSKLKFRVNQFEFVSDGSHKGQPADDNPAPTDVAAQPAADQVGDGEEIPF
jgi:single-strand DNA-binding protein